MLQVHEIINHSHIDWSGRYSFFIDVIALNTYVEFFFFFLLCMQRWLPKTNMFTVYALCVQLPWQRGWCWVQLGPRCQVTAELWEWRRGAWALGGGERVKGASRIRGLLQRERATKTGSFSLRVKQQKTHTSIWVRAPDWKIRCFSSLSAPSCHRILILGCTTKQLYSLEETHKQNKPCQQHKVMCSILNSSRETLLTACMNRKEE